VAEFDGYDERKAGRFVKTHGLDGRKAREIDKEHARELLGSLRNGVMNRVSPKLLGAVGPLKRDVT
jgi:hypothetical protein